MRRWSLVVAALACAGSPGVAGSYLDALDSKLEQQCFTDEAAAVRDRMIYAARFVACPDFSELPAKYRALPMQADHIRMADTAACRAYLERSWRQMVAIAQASPDGRSAFCRAAQQRRDMAVGSPGTAPLEALIRALEGAIGKGEKLIGAWIDDMHPCGIVALVATARGPQKLLGCSDGSASGQVALQEIEPPAEARRAWHTPGLKRRSITVLGERTVEYLDAKGERHDYYQLIELRDGTLLLLEDGVGIDGPVVALRARPFNVAEAREDKVPPPRVVAEDRRGSSIPAVAGPLNGQSTGEDYMRATTTERTDWGLAVATIVLERKTPLERAAAALSVVRCLDEALTVRRPAERVAVAMMRRQKLAELTALCAIMAGMR